LTWRVLATVERPFVSRAERLVPYIVAVNVGEQIAAKNALQNAAVDLAERLVPKLAVL